jgi:parvulin-like peptidyl-prolyl isomerase
VAAALLAFVKGAAGAEILDGVAAIVNSNIITYSEVRDYVQPVLRQLSGTYEGQELVGKVRGAQMDALNNLIDRQLIIQEFNTKGFSMPPTAVDEQLNDVIANEFGGNRTAFIKTLEAERLTLNQYRDQLRDNLIVRAMRDHKARQEVIVSPYKIEKHYKDHLDDYKVGDQIKLRMIFIKKTVPTPVPSGETTAAGNVGNVAATSNTNETAAARPSVASGVSTNEPVSVTNMAVAPPPADPQRKLGEEILAKLDAGDSFESMAKLYSQGREAKEGGDWGWIGHDILRKELSDAAFALKPGQHSRLIETDDGYYLLQVTDLKTSHTKPLTEVRDEIEKILLEQQRTKMQEQWVKDLRAKAYIRMY